MVSCFVGIAGFSFLVTTHLPLPHESEQRQPKNIVLSIEQFENKQQNDASPQPESVRKTSPEVSEEQLDETMNVEGDDPAETKGDRIEDTHDVFMKLKVELDALEKEAADIKTEKERLSSQIQRKRILSDGFKYKVATEGASSGAVRSLDLTGWPQDVVNSIMNRYDITIERKRVSGRKALPLLNSAQTDEATFTYQDGTGYYEVLTVGQSAIFKLADLEQRAIVENGYDPERARVDLIVFGIVHKEGIYDLGVIRFQAREVR